MHNLRGSKKLNLSAEIVAKRLAERGKTIHSPKLLHSYGMDYGVTMKLCDFIGVFWSENLYYSLNPSPIEKRTFEAFKGWQHSEGHNRNMLSPFPSHFGIGRATDPNDPTQVYLVQHFGSNDNEPCDYNHHARMNKTKYFTSAQIADYNSIGRGPILDQHGNLKIDKPIYIQMAGGIEPTIRQWESQDLVQAVKSHSDNLMKDFPSYTSGSKKWQELSGKKPPPEVDNESNTGWSPWGRGGKSSSSSPAPVTPPSSPDKTTPQRLTAKDLASPCVRFAGQSPTPASPINNTANEYNNGVAVGSSNAYNKLVENLKDPKLVALITTVMLGVGLVWYFRASIYRFFKGFYEGAKHLWGRLRGTEQEKWSTGTRKSTNKQGSVHWTNPHSDYQIDALDYDDPDQDYDYDDNDPDQFQDYYDNYDYDDNDPDQVQDYYDNYDYDDNDPDQVQNYYGYDFEQAQDYDDYSYLGNY